MLPHGVQGNQELSHLGKLSDPNRLFLDSTRSRFADAEIIKEVKSRISPNKTLNILELAGGTSRNDGKDTNYKSFDLARHLKSVYGNNISMTVTDIHSDNLNLSLPGFYYTEQDCCFVVLTQSGKEIDCFNSTIGGVRSHGLESTEIANIILRDTIGNYHINMEAKLATYLADELAAIYCVAKTYPEPTKIILRPFIDANYEASMGIIAKGKVDIEKVDLKKEFDVIYVRHHYYDSLRTYDLKSVLSSLSFSGVFIFEQDGRITEPVLDFLKSNYPQYSISHSYTPCTSVVKFKRKLLSSLTFKLLRSKQF